MFLSESYTQSARQSYDNVPLNYADFALSESETFHSLVESMIIAEHTAIVNEDVNLLNEAKESFFTKIADLFKTFAAWVKKVWDNFVNWISSVFQSNEKLADKWLSASSKHDVTIKNAYPKANWTYSTSLENSDVKSIWTAAVGGIDTILNATPKRAENANEEIKSYYSKFHVIILKKANIADLNDETNVGKFNAGLKEKLLGERNEQKYSVNDMNNIAKYLKENKKARTDSSKAFKMTIKQYNELNKYFSQIAKNEKKNFTDTKRWDDSYRDVHGDLSKMNSAKATSCRKMASFLNGLLSTCISIDKSQVSLARAILTKSLYHTKEEAPEAPEASSNDNTQESADVLSMFSI